MSHVYWLESQQQQQQKTEKKKKKTWGSVSIYDLIN